MEESVRHKTSLEACVNISAEQKWRRRFGGRAVVEAGSGKQPRNWLILTESSGPASCLQVHPACGTSGQLLSQLKKARDATTSCHLCQSASPFALRTSRFPGTEARGGCSRNRVAEGSRQNKSRQRTPGEGEL